MEILWVAYLSATVNGEAPKRKAGQPKSAPKKVEGARPVRQLSASSSSASASAVAVFDDPSAPGLRLAPAFFGFSVVALAASMTWPGLVIRLCT